MGENRINDWGKEPIFDRVFTEKMIEYFDISANFLERIETATKSELKEFAVNLPTLQGYCALIKIDRDTFFRWLKEARDESYVGKDKEYKIEFLNTFKKCREIQEKIWIENSLKGLYPSSFATFVGKNIFAWGDKSELSEKTNGEVKDSNKIFHERIKKNIDAMEASEIDKLLLDILN